MTETDQPGETLTIRRTFDAARERVYRAFTESDELERWFVPDGMTAEVRVNELEAGGEMAVTWRDGDDRIDNEGRYVEVIENERVVSGEETDDGELRLTYEFRDAGGGTEVVITQEFPGSVPDGAEAGWTSMLDRLASMLDGEAAGIGSDDPILTVSRTFDAPRERVWAAWTDADELRQWWGPRRWTLPVCELDFREGGEWHYCMRGPDGEESWGLVTFEEIVDRERIVSTDVFADESGDPVEDSPEMGRTVEFRDAGGGTDVVVTQTGIPTDEVALDQAELGLEQTLAKLETHLEDDR